MVRSTISSRFIEIYERVTDLSNHRLYQKGKVKLVVVTKKQPIEKCLEVISAGATDLGENYPEEAITKYSAETLNNTELHLIGHLQSRKIQFLEKAFSYWHTIDYLGAAKKVSDRFSEKGRILPALIEVNLSNELSKNGIVIRDDSQEKQFIESIQSYLDLPGIKLCGLMTMGYYPITPDTNKNLFQKCRILQQKIQEHYKLNDFCELSMGTSSDYGTAIMEGATFVRIGELIMGKRLLRDMTI